MKHTEEIKALQFRVDAAIKDLVTVQEEKAIQESVHIKHRKSIEKTINDKIEEVEIIKTEHLKEVLELKSIQTDNGDLNLRRLKKMFAELKKEKLKLEET